MRAKPGGKRRFRWRILSISLVKWALQYDHLAPQRTSADDCRSDIVTWELAARRSPEIMTKRATASQSLACIVSESKHESHISGNMVTELWTMKMQQWHFGIFVHLHVKSLAMYAKTNIATKNLSVCSNPTLLVRMSILVWLYWSCVLIISVWSLDCQIYQTVYKVHSLTHSLLVRCFNYLNDN